MFFPVETVVFKIPTVSGEDSLGNDIITFTELSVENCLVAPLSSNDNNYPFEESNVLRIVIHLPKTFIESLEEAKAVVRGADFNCIGETFSYSTSPLMWDKSIVLEKA